MKERFDRVRVQPEVQAVIECMTVRCERPDWAVRWHCGYPPRPIDHHGVPLLCERFDLDLPEAFR
jgi:lincosamide nucleotidyltransferase A/C/D/E